jgi:hypothetical protein
LESDDVAQGRRAARQHRHPIEPKAMPPCGGAPARSPSSRNPKRRSRGLFVDA